MNQRIEQLAKQAGHTPLEPRTFADDLNEIFLQKFAKLIIEECIDTAFHRGHPDLEFLLEHFGVEE